MYQERYSERKGAKTINAKKRKEANLMNGCEVFDIDCCRDYHLPLKTPGYVCIAFVCLCCTTSSPFISIFFFIFMNPSHRTLDTNTLEKVYTFSAFKLLA
ncbi:hypothetical protein OUZ56_026653 [Daphnia magna]|uniref:Uncharacterized protein n=1 Tax=Daphnia magna TaxID=35525 RepID=A0ABQ9ZNR7_9CRUS|nr:hypothetical protein OUZ56_026653 [Daphnia magna]